MGPGARLILALNRLFPRPAHPFNLAAAGHCTYAEWQYRMAPRTLAAFGPACPAGEILPGRRLLDLGCGAGGKAVYYAVAGAARSVGVDVRAEGFQEGMALARREGVADRTEFVRADAARLPFPDSSFDVVLATDVVEHLADPGAALAEASRVLAPGGRVLVSFPPYGHPYGAHLSDVIGIPWVHVFFPEPVLGEAYAHLVARLPDGAARLRLRFGAGPGERPERITYINRMTIRRFRRLLGRAPLEVEHYREVPLRNFLRPLQAALPEYFTRLVVCVLRKR